MVILAGRRLLVARVRATTSALDYAALILLLITILTGDHPTTLFVNLLGDGCNYRTAVAPPGSAACSPAPGVTVIANAPVVYELHAASAWLTWAVWPFSRLVHAWASRCGTCGGRTSSTAAVSVSRPLSPARVGGGGGGAGDLEVQRRRGQDHPGQPSRSLLATQS